MRQFLALFLIGINLLSASVSEAADDRQAKTASEPARAQSSESRAVNFLQEHRVDISLTGFYARSHYRGIGSFVSFIPTVSFEGERLFVRDLSAGIKLYKTDALELSVLAEYDANQFDASDSDDVRMKKLDNRHSSVLAGLQMLYTSPYGLFGLKVQHDALGHSKGLVSQAYYGLSKSWNQFELTGMGGTYWSNARYNRYYYGISQAESSRSGLKAYRPGAAFTPFLHLDLNYVINRHWDVTIGLDSFLIPHKIRQSDMTTSRRTQHVGSLQICYTF